MWVSAFFIAGRLCPYSGWGYIAAAAALFLLCHSISAVNRYNTGEMPDYAGYYPRAFARAVVISAVGRVIMSQPPARKGLPGIDIPGAASLRSAISRSIDDPILDKRTRDLMRALILADRRAIGWKLSEEYASLGVAHFLALSGLHLGIISVFAAGAVAALPLSRILRDLAVLALLIVYSSAAGNPHSLLRALALLSAVRISRAAGIRSSLMQALTAGALALVLYNNILQRWIQVILYGCGRYSPFRDAST
jgi:predicted membrane metal-binding protein